MVPLKYLSNVWRTLEVPLINCENNYTLTCSKKCVIGSNTPTNQETTFAITDTKLYVVVVTLSAQDNPKLLQRLKSGFKITTIWNKYQWKKNTRAETKFRLLNWSKFSRSKYNFFVRMACHS